MSSPRRIGGSLAAGLTLLGAASAVVPAGAAETGEARRETIADEVSALQETIDEVDAEAQAIQAELEETRAARAVLDAEVADLDARVAGERAALQTAERGLEAAIAMHLHTRDRLAAAERDLDESREVIQEQAVTAYMRFGSAPSELDAYLGGADIREVHGLRAFVDAVAAAQGEEVDRYQTLRARGEDLAKEAEETRATADRRRSEVATRTEALESLRDRLSSARDSLAAEAGREERLLAEVESRKADYETRVAALRQESDSIAEWLRASQSQQVVVTRGNGALGSPLANARMTSAFGYRVHPIFGTRRLHAGIDFGAATGTPILAAADGTVAFAGVKGGYGNTVVVDHGGAMATLYAHQSRINVGSGANVVRGQVIGYVGSTGNSTGPHLHFEVRVSGNPVDPRPYL